MPMFVVVDQDYIPRYSHELLIRPGDAFFVECASLFVEGSQPGHHMTIVSGEVCGAALAP